MHFFSKLPQITITIPISPGLSDLTRNYLGLEVSVTQLCCNDGPRGLLVGPRVLSGTPTIAQDILRLL